MKPLLRSFLVCNNIFATERGYDVEGIIFDVVSSRYPISVTLQFFAIWSGLGEMNYTMDIRVLMPDLRSSKVFSCRLYEGDYTPGYDVPVIMEPYRLRVPCPGDIRFEVFLNDRSFGTFYVPVYQTEGF